MYQFSSNLTLLWIFCLYLGFCHHIHKMNQIFILSSNYFNNFTTIYIFSSFCHKLNCIFTSLQNQSTKWTTFALDSISASNSVKGLSLLASSYSTLYLTVFPGRSHNSNVIKLQLHIMASMKSCSHKNFLEYKIFKKDFFNGARKAQKLNAIHVFNRIWVKKSIKYGKF